MATYVCAQLVSTVCRTWVVQEDVFTSINAAFGITMAQATKLSMAICLFFCVCAVFRKLSKMG